MSGDLQAYAAHCRHMATAEHKPECERDYQQRLDEWMYRLRSGQERPTPCPGCVTDEDHARWGMLAAEAEAYLHRDPEPTLL